MTETSPFFTIFPKGYQNTENTGGTVGKILPNSALKIISTKGESGKYMITSTFYGDFADLQAD